MVLCLAIRCDRSATISAYPRPHQLLIEGYFAFRRCDFWKERRERFDEVEKAHYDGNNVSLPIRYTQQDAKLPL